MAESEQDPAMAEVVTRFEASGLSLHDLGVKMGYPVETARMSAWQFIQKTKDPRIGMLRRFAKALEIPIETLVTPTKKKGKTESEEK